jgi:hypothetical protein
MAKTLKQIKEVYRPKSGDEQKFIDKHIVAKTEDANGNGDEVFSGSKVKKIDRKKENHGYDAGEDEKVYEEVEQDITSVLLEMYAECDDDERAELIKIIEEGRLEEFLQELEEELQKEEEHG